MLVTASSWLWWDSRFTVPGLAATDRRFMARVGTWAAPRKKFAIRWGGLRWSLSRAPS